MGWRGFLRSAAARSRHLEQERERTANRIFRVHRRAESLMSQISEEAERDLRKVETFEEKIYKSPVKTLDLKFNGSDWNCTPLVDRTGKINFTLAPGLTSDNVTFSPDSIEFEGRTYMPLACCLCPYATFIAFTVKNAPATDVGEKSRRLINKSNPQESAVALLADDEAFFPFDGTIDGPVLTSVKNTRIVAFEPFLKSVQSFQIAFLPRSTKRDSDPDPETVKVTGKCIPQTIAAFGNSPSLVEQFEKLVTKHVDAKKNEIRSAVKSRGRAKSGCMVAISVLFLVGLLLVTGKWQVELLAGSLGQP